MGIYLRPIRKTYINEGELDQVENTVNFAKKASTNKLPQLQMVVKDLKTNLEHGKFFGGNQSFSKTVWRYNFDYDDTIASLPIGTSSSLWGCLPAYKSSYQKKHKEKVWLQRK
jgi:hypothetical protein